MAAACLLLLTGGCAATSFSLVAQPSVGTDARQRYLACAGFFDNLDQAVRDAGAEDVQTAAVLGYPYLHVNRFLASLRDRSMSHAKQRAWIDRLQALGTKAWSVELANLPAERRSALARSAPIHAPLLDVVHQCGRQMRRLDLMGTQGLERLRGRIKVPGEYRPTWRLLGLYPVTAFFFSFGVDRLHRDTLATFARPLKTLPVNGRLIRYVPPAGKTLTTEQVADILTRSSTNPLQIPTPTPEQRARLFATFAPVWEVDVDGRDDRIGTPGWTGEHTPHVDTGRPVVYRLLSHTWWHDRALLQLNYVIWFPARPPGGRMDPYAGHMDGIDLRVTLGLDGHPLIYDSIHNCGCYQKFFPTRRVRPRLPGNRAAGEPALIPQMAPEIDKDQRLIVRIAHRTHFLRRLYADKVSGGQDYHVADYDTLRSLPLADGRRRSLFDEQGFVPGTERAERWWLWPMGVPNAGAMRQWGHHATAFVGTRYFDSPHLIENLFALVPFYYPIRSTQ